MDPASKRSLAGHGWPLSSSPCCKNSMFSLWGIHISSLEQVLRPKSHHPSSWCVLALLARLGSDLLNQEGSLESLSGLLKVKPLCKRKENTLHPYKLVICIFWRRERKWTSVSHILSGLTTKAGARLPLCWGYWCVSGGALLCAWETLLGYLPDLPPQLGVVCVKLSLSEGQSLVFTQACLLLKPSRSQLRCAACTWGTPLSWHCCEGIGAWASTASMELMATLKGHHCPLPAALLPHSGLSKCAGWVLWKLLWLITVPVFAHANWVSHQSLYLRPFLEKWGSLPLSVKYSSYSWSSLLSVWPGPAVLSVGVIGLWAVYCHLKIM